MLRKFNGPETLRFWEFKGPNTSKSCTILVLSCTLSCVVVEVGVGLWHLLDLHPEAWIMIVVWIVLWLRLGLGCDIYHVPSVGSQSKYKYSIIQTEQNTTKCNKIQQDKIQKFQNTNTTKYKRTKYKLPKYKCNKIQMQQNTNGKRYK